MHQAATPTAGGAELKGFAALAGLHALLILALIYYLDLLDVHLAKESLNVLCGEMHAGSASLANGGYIGIRMACAHILPLLLKTEGDDGGGW